MTFHTHTPLPVYRTAEIRAIEAAASNAPHPPALMERAGLAAAQIARDVMRHGGRRVLVVAGPGNNGGDAFVVARHLKAWSFEVDVVFTGDAARLAADAQAALAAWRAGGGLTLERVPSNQHWDLVIDGLFGIGLQRDLSDEYAALVATLNRLDATVLALDVPSGIDADTGRVHGCAVRADHTATFIGLKPGLLTLDGPDHCGEYSSVHARCGCVGRPCSTRCGHRQRNYRVGATRAARQQPQRRLRQRRYHRRCARNGGSGAPRRPRGIATRNGPRVRRHCSAMRVLVMTPGNLN